jgi:hypothetical protein
MSPRYQDFVKKNFNLVGGSSPQVKMSNVAKLWRKQKGGMWKEAATPRASIHIPQPFETPVVGKHRRTKAHTWQVIEAPQASIRIPHPHETPVVGDHRRPPPIYELDEVKIPHPVRRRGIKPPVSEIEKKIIATIVADELKEGNSKP